MSAQAAIHIPELESNLDSWTVVRKDTCAVIYERMSREFIEGAGLDPAKFEVLTRRQYLLKSGDHAVIEIGARDLLEQLTRRGLVDNKKFTNLASALKALSL